MHLSTEQPGPASVQDLPASVLVKILQLVPLKQRLASCALVCSAWASATTAATTHLLQHEVQLSPGQDVRPLLAWLRLRAANLRVLQLDAFYCRLGGPALQLPWDSFANLQELQGHGLSLSLPCDPEINDQVWQDPSMSVAGADASISTSASTQADSSPLLPSLQKLQLSRCTFWNVRSFMQLARAPQLTCLVAKDLQLTEAQQQLWQWGYELGPPRVDANTAAAIAGLLQQLPGLSVLQLQGNLGLKEAAVQHIAAMSGLRQLSIHLCGGVAPDCVARLPSSITQLCLSTARAEVRPVLSSQLQRMTAVVDLELSAFAVHPVALGPMQRVLRLSLVDCSLLPRPAGAAQQHAGAAGIMDLLASLTALQHLQLDLDDLSTAQLPLQRFSALTASSHLTELRMMCHLHAAPLPKGAAQHMFPTGKQLPQLVRLSFGTNAGMRTRNAWERVSTPGWLSCAELGRMIQSCPALQSLQLLSTVDDWHGLDELLQLPKSCRTLAVGGEAFGNRAAGVVAQLTQLEDLSFIDALYLMDGGVEKLAALKGLTQLRLVNCDSLSYGFAGDENVWCFCDDRRKGPVWMQLQAKLDEVRAEARWNVPPGDDYYHY